VNFALFSPLTFKITESGKKLSMKEKKTPYNEILLVFKLLAK
jgi:hypothetical protein